MTKNIIFISIFWTLILNSVFTAVTGKSKSQPCPLVWKNTMLSLPIPEDAVPTHGTEHFIIRGVVQRNWWFQTYSHGRVSNSTGEVALFSSENRANLKTNFYQILTNPNDCYLKWTHTELGGSVTEEHLRVPFGFVPGYVARVASDSIQVAAQIKEDFVYLPGMDQSQKEHAMNSQVLLSSVNLRLELTNFKFSEVVQDGDADVMGLDVITNDSGVEVNHTVTHRKTVTHKYTFEESTSFSQVTAWSIGLSIPIAKGVSLKLGFDWSNENGDSSSSSVSHEEEKEVRSERTIIVPPFTSIEACSFSNFNDNARLPYEAEGRYTVKGQNAQTVRALVEAAGITDILRTEGNAVIAKVTCEMTVAIPTKTSFTITSIGDPNGCRATVKKLNDKRRARIFGRK